MAGNIKGITIQFEGDTTKLDRALKQVDKSTAKIDRELNKVNTALKFNPTNVELWRQKQQLLSQKITETKTRLDALKQAQKKMDSEKVDKTSQEYRELQREIITTESKLKTFKGQLASIGNANIKALSEKLKSVGSKMTSIGKTMTTSVTMPIVAGFTLASKYASDYEENMNKLDVAFGKSSKAVKKWAKTAGKQFGLSQVQATESASAFGALGKGIGLSEKQSAKMSMSLAGLSADLGSYFNVGTDESAKALEGIFTGESEALKKFGVVMTDTNLKQFAKDQGLVYEELSQTEKTQLRYNYVLAKTKDAQGDFSRTSSGTANTIKTFKAAIQDLATGIGTQLLPIVTPVIQFFSDLLNKMGSLSPMAQRIITIIGLVAAAAGPLLVIIGSIATAIGTIMPMIAGISAPVLAVVAVIGALIAAIGTAYAKSTSFRKVINDLGKMLASTFAPVVKQVISTFKTLFTEIVKTATSVATSLAPVLKALMPVFKTVATFMAGVLKKAFETISDIIKTLGSIVRTVASAFSKGFGTIVDVVKGAYTKVKDVVDKITGVIKKIKDKIDDVFPISLGNIFSDLKLPHISVSGGKAPFGIAGKGSLPKFSVKWYARGGIFNSPTLAGIGEAGPEAVVPLDKFWKKLEQMQGGDVISINVYGSDGMSVNDLAEAVEQKLIQAQKRRKLAWQ